MTMPSCLLPQPGAQDSPTHPGVGTATAACALLVSHNVLQHDRQNAKTNKTEAEPPTPKALWCCIHSNMHTFFRCKERQIDA